jgi:hypothetical protein
MATILALRQRLIAESAITTAAETMLVDLAVLSYYHTLRVQGWIGHLAVRIEHEFFGDDAFTEMARQGFRRTDRFAVEERVRQLREQLMPLFDRANRMMLRNLKAIKELRQGQVPAVAMGRAEKVTVTSRPNRRLRPVKPHVPQALSDRVSELPRESPTPSRQGLIPLATPSLGKKQVQYAQSTLQAASDGAWPGESLRSRMKTAYLLGAGASKGSRVRLPTMQEFFDVPDFADREKMQLASRPPKRQGSRFQSGAQHGTIPGCRHFGPGGGLYTAFARSPRFARSPGR